MTSWCWLRRQARSRHLHETSRLPAATGDQTGRSSHGVPSRVFPVILVFTREAARVDVPEAAWQRVRGGARRALTSCNRPLVRGGWIRRHGLRGAHVLGQAPIVVSSSRSAPMDRSPSNMVDVCCFCYTASRTLGQCPAIIGS